MKKFYTYLVSAFAIATIIMPGVSAQALTFTTVDPFSSEDPFQSTNTCTPNPQGHLSVEQGIAVSGSSSGGEVFATLKNNSSNCTYSVGLATYETTILLNNNNQEFIDTQTLFDSRLVTLTPGSSAKLEANLPTCNWQADLFQGSFAPVPPDFAKLMNQGTHWLFDFELRHNLGVCGDVAPQPITADIKANGSDGPITIPFNTSANLTWTSQNANSCVVQPGNFTGVSGQRQTGSLTSSRTFFLTCTGNSGTATDSVTVNVQSQPQPQPITADIKANGSDGPITIPFNTSANLTWTSQNATSCNVQPGNFTGVFGQRQTSNLTGTRTFNLFCTGAGGTASDSVTVNVQSQPQPITADIRANGSDGPITIPFNTSANLTWTSQNASSCNVTPGNFTGVTGSRQTQNLTATRTFNLFCTGAGGTASDSVTVNVQSQPQPITADIKANGSDGPITIPFNTSANLTWTSQNASSCTVTPDGFTGTTGSASTGNLTNTRTYNLTCTGQGGTASDSVTVNVQSQPQPITADIKANGSDGPITIPVNTSATLTWTSQGANSCTVHPGNFTGVSGSQSVTLSNSQTYTVFCTGAGGTASDSVTVNVQSQPNAPTADIKANGSDGPVIIPFNTSATLTWTSQNANSCNVQPGNFTGVSGQRQTNNLTGTQTFTVFCTGAGGTATDSVTVTVQQANLPTVDINSNPSSITQGQTSVLTWTSQNANSCTASNGWSGGKSISGNETVSPFVTTTYTIVCSNQFGVAQDSTTVFVNTTPQPGTLEITKTGANLTLNQGTFSSFVQAQGQDLVEFRIRVRNTTSQSGTATVRDILPTQLTYVTGSTRIDGVSAPDGITSGGISLGLIAPGQEKVVSLRAIVLPGVTAQVISNQGSVTLNSITQNTSMSVQIQPRGQVLGAADIVTGPDNPMPWILLIGLIGSGAMHLLLFREGTQPRSRPVAFASTRGSTKSSPRNTFEEYARELRNKEKRPDLK